MPKRRKKARGSSVRIAYFDTFSGISGDMTIGAFLDLGVPLSVLEEGLAPLGLDEVTLDVGFRIRSGIRATKFGVTVATASGHDHDHGPADHDHGHDHPHADHDHPHKDAHGHPHDHGHHGDARGHPHDHGHHGGGAGHRPYREIRDLLARSGLRPGVRARAEKVFHALAIAEARIHAMSVEDVEFHEVGSADALVDIVGTALCLDHLGIERIYASPLPLGSGRTRSQHGVIPVPAPATVELLRGFPSRMEDGAAELVTPTGAAIIAALAEPGRPPTLSPIASGWGAGERELADRPNLLRIILAEVADPPPAPAHGGGDLEHDEMIVLEANVDDMNPEWFEPASEALFEAGARDVSLSPLVMKKGRPGTLLRVIASPDEESRLTQTILRETSTIGVRSHRVVRAILPRRSVTVPTRYGNIPVKVVALPGGGERRTPEYADCRRAARTHGVPISRVYEEVLVRASTLQKEDEADSRLAGPGGRGTPGSGL
jgi:uncharacterized protein (TIGR00299 family) protein